MSGSQKHSYSSTYYVDNAGNAMQPSSLIVPVAKWSGGSNQTTGIGGSSSGTGNSTLGAGFASSSLRSVQARSRNIDIPNSKPRPRPKHLAPTISRVPSSSRTQSARKSNSSTVLPGSAHATTLSSAGNLNWHTRPPRGGLTYQPSYHVAPVDDSPLKRGKNNVAARRRDEHAFAPISDMHAPDVPSWDDELDRDEDVYRISESHRRDPKHLELTSAAISQATPAITRSKDAVEDLARALLTDCINRRNIEQQKMKKIKIETPKTPPATSSSSGSMSGSFPSPKELDMKSMPLYEDGGGVLSCSSSDDELNQLYMLDPSLVWDDKCRSDECHSKMCNDSSHCHDVDNMVLTSSPDSDGFFEEKGLPKEVRYNLPIAYGTVNETEKHCTICQVPYEIGSHIVTLTPCQHFFHALCVDKWLWNHVTCPLCRKEVVYEQDMDVLPASVHVRGTECPEDVQENMRKKLRAQCAEFRPVKPHPVSFDMDQLDAHFSGMQVQDERKRLRLDHLVWYVM
ncbi:Aste57867_14706 [Aphanomyces stellatus]|uniref:Aste57867_14706 protein n=1 Tax=Aphanomyces stellatus TaxID=120398 RepID=A0A485L1D6_9STRA|nr:hypothetical protein As57867_014651 [Aphanomyces stellatus]VFT91524.1 Aste57867_14706 [Aphanomyces stellatus]